MQNQSVRPKGGVHDISHSRIRLRRLARRPSRPFAIRAQGQDDAWSEATFATGREHTSLADADILLGTDLERKEVLEDRAER